MRGRENQFTSFQVDIACFALSFPEDMLLKKVMTGKMLAIFFGVVPICIIISGYLFNVILYL